MKKIFLLVFICLIFSLTLFSDEKSHFKASKDLLLLSLTEESYNQLIVQSLDLQIQSNPSIEPFRATMLEFMQKYMGLNAIIDDMARLYMEYFNEKEIKGLIKFYKTDLGKKSQKLMPVLFQKGAEIGQKKVQANLPELQAMIETESQRLRSQTQ